MRWVCNICDLCQDEEALKGLIGKNCKYSFSPCSKKKFFLSAALDGLNYIEKISLQSH